MPEKHAIAEWRGDLRTGEGEVTSGSGALQRAKVTYATRFENVPGTSPEEMIAAAHAVCYSIALADILNRRGLHPDDIRTRATVAVEPRSGGWKITRSHLVVEGQVPGIDNTAFQEIAHAAEDACPVSNALRGNVDIILEAALIGVTTMV